MASLAVLPTATVTSSTHCRAGNAYATFTQIVLSIAIKRLCALIERIDLVVGNK